MRKLCILATAMWTLAAITIFGIAPSVAQPVRPPVLTAAGPDLAPIPTRLEHGVISVRNIGASTSAPSIVTVHCHKAGLRGGCAEAPARYEAAYTDPAYPDRLVVEVPALAPGHVHNHTLPFWPAMVWASGSYEFEFVADAGASNAETNEANNSGSWTKVVP